MRVVLGIIPFYSPPLPGLSSKLLLHLYFLDFCPNLPLPLLLLGLLPKVLPRSAQGAATICLNYWLLLLPDAATACCNYHVLLLLPAVSCHDNN